MDPDFNNYDELARILADSLSNRVMERAFFGFDGYIDTIKKAVKHRSHTGEASYFQNIAEFGLFLAAQAGKSAEYEVLTICRKIGGNAPIMALAAASLGVPSTCVGALGYPGLDGTFASPVDNLQFLSVAKPGITDAFEFDDGKLMFGETSSLRDLNWDLAHGRLKEKGIDLVEQMAQCKLIAVLNWASLVHVTSFVKGILHNLSERYGQQALASKIMLFDLADISCRDKNTVLDWMSMIEHVPCTTILSLNLKEAQLLSKILTDKQTEDAAELCTTLGSILNINTVVIHDRRGSWAFDGKNLSYADGFFVEKPALSTGGGDNFNGGFAFGMLNSLPTEQCLALGNAVSSLYVRSGQSPTVDTLLNFLGSQKSQLVALEER